MDGIVFKVRKSGKSAGAQYFIGKTPFPKWSKLHDDLFGTHLGSLSAARSIHFVFGDHDCNDRKKTNELTHCLQNRDKNGQRIEFQYTVYVLFLPQHHKKRVNADSIAQEELFCKKEKNNLRAEKK